MEVSSPPSPLDPAPTASPHAAGRVGDTLRTHLRVRLTLSEAQRLGRPQGPFTTRIAK